MDKLYFCKNCIAAWKKKQFMSCCHGCKEHQHEGWNTDEMLTTYSNLIETFGKAYFPMEFRPYPPPKRKTHCTIYNNFTEAEKWLNSTPKLLPFFKQQQKNIMKTYKKHPTKELWELLDPWVQDKISIKLIMKY